MLIQSPQKTEIEIDQFDSERPAVQIAKDIYSLVNENFAAIDADSSGCITLKEIDEFPGNQRLKNFLKSNIKSLSMLSFKARNLKDLLFDCRHHSDHTLCVSYTDLNTFVWLTQNINRANFYDGNFQSLRVGVGLRSSAFAFLAGIVAGWLALAFLFSKLHLAMPPLEAIAVGVIGTVGVPLFTALFAYLLATGLADRYYRSRIAKIDEVLDNLEKAT